jgi:acyl-CoA reductase-like NAD-dependent aldehyde dehydrogenase
MCLDYFIQTKICFRRLESLIDKSKVVLGGEIDERDLYISPTVMFDVNENDKIMGEEIFGPILPFVTVQDHNEAIDFINKRYFHFNYSILFKVSHFFTLSKKRETIGTLCVYKE